MPAETPVQLDALLLEALEQPPERRAAFIQHACGGDTRIRHDLESLLRLHAQAGDFLEHPPVALPERADDASAGESPGTVIGSYKLLERIGEGGFGSVFMAEQEKPVRRRVALKIIKLGMDTRSVIARFEAERQALAMMDHPCIARVFDAGATESGRPYFVMELVKGTPITAFCDEQCLTVGQRLELFIQVCQAVQHAHTKGVIHRDLKPSNVLAVRHDGTPTVKVIDFGIAKATGDRLTDKTLFTEFRQLIGTPAYMSPEQAGQSDIDVDTRSDIYSLGVLLYELLTGTTPFDAKSLQSSGYDEMRRVIREVEPPSPSRRLSSLSEPCQASDRLVTTSARGSSSISQKPIAGMRASVSDRSDSSSITLANVAAQRRSEPPALVRQLHGDLDWIVMNCLEKNRARRYETASALAADVQRHMAGEPVVAAPPSRVYQISKALRRHRGAAAVIAGFTLLTSVGLIATGSLWRQAADARDAESDQRARNEAINTFLKGMLTAADPTKARGEKLTVTDALKTAADRIDAGALQEQPLVEAELRVTIGETFYNLTQYSPAEAQLRAAEAIFERELGAEHSDTLHTRVCLAETLLWSSQYAAAAKLAEPAWKVCRRTLGPEHFDTLRVMIVLGIALPEVNRFEEGEALLASAVDITRRKLGPHHPDTADALNSLGGIYIYHNRPEKAEPLFRESWRIHSAALGEEDLRTLDSHAWLGSALYNQNRAEEAEVIFRRSAEAHKRLLGPDHTKTIGRTGDLGAALNRLGRYVEAEPFLRESYEACLRHHGRMYVGTISGRRFLASCVKAQGRLEEAEKLLRESLQDSRVAFGPEHGDTSVRLMCALAEVLAEQHKDVEAEEVGREVLAIQLRKVPRADQDQVTQCAQALHAALLRQRKSDDALRVSRELLDFLMITSSEPDAGAPGLNRTAWLLLTIDEQELRDPAKALELAQRAVEKSNRKNPAFMDTLALAYQQTNQKSKAVEIQTEAVALLEADSPDRADYEARLRTYESQSPESDMTGN